MLTYRGYCNDLHVLFGYTHRWIGSEHMDICFKPIRRAVISVAVCNWAVSGVLEK